MRCCCLLTSAPVLSADGPLITGHAGGTAQLWDARIGAPLRGHASDVMALAPEGSQPSQNRLK